MKRFVTIFYTLFLSSLSKVEEVILARKFKLAAKEVNKVDILKTLLQCESLWHLDFMCYEALLECHFMASNMWRVKATNSEQKGGHLQLTPPMILIPDARPTTLYSIF